MLGLGLGLERERFFCKIHATLLYNFCKLLIKLFFFFSPEVGSLEVLRIIANTKRINLEICRLGGEFCKIIKCMVMVSFFFFFQNKLVC